MITPWTTPLALLAQKNGREKACTVSDSPSSLRTEVQYARRAPYHSNGGVASKFFFFWYFFGGYVVFLFLFGIDFFRGGGEEAKGKEKRRPVVQITPPSWVRPCFFFATSVLFLLFL